jgi:hypothetical protein
MFNSKFIVMKTEKNVPFYAIVNGNNSVTIEYRPYTDYGNCSITGRLDGCGLDKLKEMPGNLPVLYTGNADFVQITSFILKHDSPGSRTDLIGQDAELDAYLQQWIVEAEKHGYEVMTAASALKTVKF